jgi:hypothetical protein
MKNYFRCEKALQIELLSGAAWLFLLIIFLFRLTSFSKSDRIGLATDRRVSS